MPRQLPYECPHGRILDWGDFGPAHGFSPDYIEYGAGTPKDVIPEGCLECMELIEQGPIPVTCGPQFGETIARHLGLDPEKIRSMDIHIGPGLATVTVEHVILHPGETEAVESVFKDYAVVDRKLIETTVQEQVAVALKAVLAGMRKGMSS